MIIKDLDQMKKFAFKLAPLLKEGDVVNLVGEMGAGKTSLVSFLGEAYGIGDTSSPTFALVNIYDGDKRIYHLDLYRLEDEDEILDIDFETYFYPEGAISFLEWADRARSYLPEGMINIEIKKLDGDQREVRILTDSERGRQINEYIGD